MSILKYLHKKMPSKKLVITALGDSLTYGWLVQKGYIDFLDEMITVKYPGISFNIVNKGVPGDTAQDGLRRIDEIINTKPDLVLIQFALNDAFTGATPDMFQKNIEHIIGKIKENTSAQILLLTSVPVISPVEDRIAEMFYGRIMMCGAEYNIPVVKVHNYWKEKIRSGVKHSSLIQGDGVHPLENGYRLMAEAVMEFL